MGGKRERGPRRRTERCSTALRPDEAAALDAMRGALDRSTFLRWLVLDARKRGVSFGGPVSTGEGLRLLGNTYGT